MAAIWHPIWSVGKRVAAELIWALFAAGWGIVLLSTFLLSHFELFGLHQVWSHSRGTSLPEPEFASRSSTSGSGTRSMPVSSSPSGRLRK